MQNKPFTFRDIVSPYKLYKIYRCIFTMAGRQASNAASGLLSFESKTNTRAHIAMCIGVHLHCTLRARAMLPSSVQNDQNYVQLLLIKGRPPYVTQIIQSDPQYSNAYC